jgi:hypothetical protein
MINWLFNGIIKHIKKGVEMAIKTSTIESEDDYENERYFVPPPSKRLIVKRDGSSITRRIPKPVVLVDTREKSPFDFGRFPNWIADQKKQKLWVGDYSVQGMEDLLTIERGRRKRGQA